MNRFLRNHPPNFLAFFHFCQFSIRKIHIKSRMLEFSLFIRLTHLTRKRTKNTKIKKSLLLGGSQRIIEKIALNLIGSLPRAFLPKSPKTFV